MKKWMLLVLSVFVSALCAQSKENLDKEDLLAAFQQYNPSALEKASTNQSYGEILERLTASYNAPNTLENQIEMIALVKNFDNSLELYALRYAYMEGRTLQTVSGTSLKPLDENIETAITALLENVYQNTLDAKNIQIKQLKQKIKETKKSADLSAEQKKEQVALLKSQIKKTKQEIRSLKSHAKEQIASTAHQYLTDMSADYEKAQQEQLRAAQSAARNVKAKNKKPVAK